MHTRFALSVLFAMTTAVCGCKPDAETAGEAPRFAPIDPTAATFWDRQTTETASLLRTLADEFNAAHDGLPVRVVQSGSYPDIYRKVTASIRAGQLPAMAVAYESMTTEYIRSEAAVAIDRFFDDPETGFEAGELDDFFPGVIKTNTFAEFGGKMYSFPFTKSVLMLFFNKRVMREAGLSEPPRTWDAFLAQCRTVREKTGKYAMAMDIDPSTIDGMIFSMGGDVVLDGKVLYDSPESIRVFELIETLTKEKLVYQIPTRSFDDETDFGQDRIAFSLRSSSGKPHFAIVMEDPDAWGMVALPQANPDDPHTVLYGANICIFDTTPEQQATAWAFTKFFTSREITVRWALGTGYLPVRKSAAEDPAMQKFWAEWPYNRTAFDCLAFAKPEPNIAGWQELRGLVGKAQTAVLSGIMTGREAALDLQRKAEAVLARR